MLEKTDCLLFHQLSDHVAQNGANCVESFICRTNVRQPNIIEEDLLNNENRHGLA